MAASQHSRLAMKAARRMARTNHKQKVGRSVCRHLLMMIEDSQVTPVPDPGRALIRATDRVENNKKQFSLGL
jgi:hypothetical protein